MISGYHVDGYDGRILNGIGYNVLVITVGYRLISGSLGGYYSSNIGIRRPL